MTEYDYYRHTYDEAKLNDNCLRFSIEVFVSIWKLCFNAAAWTVKYGLVSYLSPSLTLLMDPWMMGNEPH